MQALAAVTAPTVAEAVDGDGGDGLDGGIYQTVAVDGTGGSFSYDGRDGSLLFDGDSVSSLSASVTYSPDGLLLSLDGDDGADTRAGAGVSLTPSTARELAAGLYAAAEEYEERTDSSGKV
jgi:hypothetical protein